MADPDLHPPSNAPAAAPPVRTATPAPAPSNSGRGGLRNQVRGMTYAQGRAALSPSAGGGPHPSNAPVPPAADASASSAIDRLAALMDAREVQALTDAQIAERAAEVVSLLGSPAIRNDPAVRPRMVLTEVARALLAEQSARDGMTDAGLRAGNVSTVSQDRGGGRRATADERSGATTPVQEQARRIASANSGPLGTLAMTAGMLTGQDTETSIRMGEAGAMFDAASGFTDRPATPEPTREAQEAAEIGRLPANVRGDRTDSPHPQRR